MEEPIVRIQTDTKKSTKDSEIFKLCDVVHETGLQIYRYLRNRHLEKVYENALVHRLQKQGIHIKQKEPIKVFDEDGAIIGKFEADLIVNERLIVDVKACKCPVDEHVA